MRHLPACFFFLPLAQSRSSWAWEAEINIAAFTHQLGCLNAQYTSAARTHATPIHRPMGATLCGPGGIADTSRTSPNMERGSDLSSMAPTSHKWDQSLGDRFECDTRRRLSNDEASNDAQPRAFGPRRGQVLRVPQGPSPRHAVLGNVPPISPRPPGAETGSTEELGRARDGEEGQSSPLFPQLPSNLTHGFLQAQMLGPIAISASWKNPQQSQGVYGLNSFLSGSTLPSFLSHPLWCALGPP